jgi:SAM-dependent methyltransferase
MGEWFQRKGVRKMTCGLEGSEPGPNADQSRYWGNAGGRAWVDLQASLDAAFAPINALLLARAAPAAGERALDIGCGAGVTALAIAERVGAEGRIVAVDISPLMLARAGERTPPSLASRVDFIEADAQVHRFPPRHFDLLVSHFGTMFFADPVAAFGNLRRTLKSGGRMHLAAWGPLEGNPWFTISRDAAVARLGAPPPVPPTAPGPLAFSDIGYVLDILRSSGFAAPAAETVFLQLEPPGAVSDAARLATSVGPASRIMIAMDGGPEDADAIRQKIAAGFAPFWDGDGVRVPAVINLFSAIAP